MCRRSAPRCHSNLYIYVYEISVKAPKSRCCGCICRVFENGRTQQRRSCTKIAESARTDPYHRLFILRARNRVRCTISFSFDTRRCCLLLLCSLLLFLCVSIVPLFVIAAIISVMLTTNISLVLVCGCITIDNFCIMFDSGLVL